MSASYHHTRSVPHCTPEDLGLQEGEFEPTVWPVIRKYFSQFDAPRKSPLANAPRTPPHCTCGEPLTGFVGSYVPIVAGEGECRSCRRPVRLHHLYTHDGETVMELKYPLLFRRAQ